MSFDYLAALTDDTGIFQHACCGIPDRAHGYCTDDAARALVVALKYHNRHKDPRALDLAYTYLSFLHHAQLPDGGFHNFMDYSRRFIDARGSEDTVGRALWGLGAAAAWAPAPAAQTLARALADRALGVEFSHPRALAYALCGLNLLLLADPSNARLRDGIRAFATRLAAIYAEHRTPGWHWFGDSLTYANAKLPEAMLRAHRATGSAAFRTIGLEALAFLLKHTYRDDRFDFVGNQGWYPRDAARAHFAQQPIEAGYTAEACMVAYDDTSEQRYLDLARAATEWFLGRNRLRIALYTPEAGACADGLEATEASLNQGAEATIAHLLAHLATADAARQPLVPTTGRNGDEVPATLPSHLSRDP